MPVMDEFKEERAALKNAPFKEKLKYFWCYYKWHTFAVIVAIIIIVSLVHTLLSYKPNAFYGAFLNTVEYQKDVDDYEKEFADFLEIDTKKNDVVFDTSLFIDLEAMDSGTVAAVQRMMVYIAAGDVDMIVTDADSLEHFSYQDALVDLRTLLTEEQIQKYEPYFYYVDEKVVRDLAAANENLDSNYKAPYPEDPLDPSLMEEPVPVGICLDSCTTLKTNLRFHEGHIIFSVVRNSKHQDLAVKYLDYTFEEPTN